MLVPLPVVILVSILSYNFSGTIQLATKKSFNFYEIERSFTDHSFRGRQ